MTWEQITVVIVDLWSVLNHDAFLRREVAQMWKSKIGTASTSSLCFHKIPASIKQICNVTMRSTGYIFTDSCCSLKTCQWLTELWAELHNISVVVVPRHSWALSYVAVSCHRDGSLCLSRTPRGKGLCCITSKVWACCSLFLSTVFPP